MCVLRSASSSKQEFADSIERRNSDVGEDVSQMSLRMEINERTRCPKQKVSVQFLWLLADFGSVPANRRLGQGDRTQH
jgi:hypothetical protein